MTETIMKTCTTFLITLITMTTSQISIKPCFITCTCLSDYTAEMKRSSDCFTPVKTHFTCISKWVFKIYFFAYRNIFTISTLAPLQSSKNRLLDVLKQSQSGISI